MLNKMSKKKAPKKLPPITSKLCANCLAENDLSAKKCKECKRDKFLPNYIRKQIKINQWVKVNVTQDLDRVSERITLSKWWPKGGQTYNIKDAEQWESIKNAIDGPLGTHLGWEGSGQVAEQISASHQPKPDKKKIDEGVDKLITTYPKLSLDMVKKMAESMKDTDPEKVLGLFNEVVKLSSEYDDLHMASLRAIIKKFEGQSTSSLASLSEVLKEWSVKQVVDVTKEVKRRLAEIDLFMERIQDDSTYEIKGDDSIHRILERSMWLIDEKYWIIQSNKQLRTFIGKELAKKDKKYEKQRPDFACGTFSGKLIIIEIKRPSHDLTVDDLDQAENYIKIAKKYTGSNYSSYEAFLYGNKISDDLRETLEFRKGIRVNTYDHLVQDCKSRYSKFLKELTKEE
jgi:hypothetical protein